MLKELTVDCPYCGECFVTQVDYSQGDQQYYEDCQICCRPILFHLHVTPDGGLAGVEWLREDD